MVTRLTYRGSGVDVSKAARLVRSMAPIADKTRRSGLMAGIGGFAGLFDLEHSRHRHPVLVSSTDGVGTKLKVAFMMNRHRTVGIDLVAMSVNDVITQGAEPLFFLDYFSTGKLRPKILLDVIRGIADGCAMAGCALMGGETAEMPSFYAEGEYDLAGFCVGVVDKTEIPDPTSVGAGDIIIGLPSSGLHSNGYSLARTVLLDHAGLDLRKQATGLGRSLGDELLTPTRIYASVFKHRAVRHRIKGMAHITGGGIVENLPRVLPPGHRAFLSRSTWSVPPIFELIQKLGQVPQREMDRTFNNGIGMVLVASPSECSGLVRTLQRHGERCAVIGEIRKGKRGVTFLP